MYSRFNGDNVGIGLDGSSSAYNPDFTPTYNPYDDNLYGYSDRPVAEIARERMTTPNQLNYDNMGRKYPGPEPPQDYSYFDQRNPFQGFTGTKQGMSPAARDYAILISSNVHYFVLLLMIVLSIIIGIVNMGLIFSMRRT
jgi:hypothetical protein